LKLDATKAIADVVVKKANTAVVIITYVVGLTMHRAVNAFNSIIPVAVAMRIISNNKMIVNRVAKEHRLVQNII